MYEYRGCVERRLSSEDFKSHAVSGTILEEAPSDPWKHHNVLLSEIPFRPAEESFAMSHWTESCAQGL
jgi:hypothetical protein